MQERCGKSKHNQLRTQILENVLRDTCASGSAWLDERWRSGAELLTLQYGGAAVLSAKWLGSRIKKIWRPHAGSGSNIWFRKWVLNVGAGPFMAKIA